MYWDDDFAQIELPNISSQSQTPQSSATVTLYLSGNAQITADDTTAAQLSCATDTLVTEYKLTFDSAGGTTGVGTGGDGGTEWQSYDTFLKTGTEGDVTYVADDNDVQVTLWVKASNNADEVADSDTYNATQTLTISWVGP
jgi:biopolymer transport protein ExbD